MINCPKCKEPIVTQAEIKDMAIEAMTRAKKLATKVVSAIADIGVEGSCGCVFCDLDLVPTEIEGKPYHVTRHGVVRCANPVS